MAMKLMLLPSARSRYVKDNNQELIYKVLLVLAGTMIISNYFMFSFMHAIKLFLMIVIAIVVTVETEILFYSHDKSIDRATSKDLIKKSYPKLTGLLFALLIPVGTPLWLVAIGAALATTLGKLLFGGFHHMVFHTSLVGVIFVTVGWSSLSNGVDFATSFDANILKFIFDNSFFNDTLGIANLYEPAAPNGIAQLASGEPYEFYLHLLGLVPGAVGSGLLILLAFFFLVYKKAVDFVVPTLLILSFLVTGFIYTLVNGYDSLYAIYHLFSGSILFIAVFITTDPITTPIPKKGKYIFGLVAGALAFVIAMSGTFDEGILFSVLFMMMLTPMLNTELKEKKKPVKKAPKKEGA